jgi:Lipocalin-like domain
MAPGRPKLSGNGLTDGTPEGYVVSGKGFIGYSGTYQVDERLSMVTHDPIVAFAPNMVGSAQERAVEISGNILTLTARHPHEPNSPHTQSRLEWIRVKSGRSEETR